jgi:opacity protein-like surface antigen
LILNSRTPINRINLSFEELDLKLSYELTSWLRLYGGGGMLVGRDPNSLQRGTSQAGAELSSPWTIWDGKVRPVAYVDIQANARSNWRVASSVMAGLQFEDARIGDRNLQVLAEYFGGPSPNGQFFLTISNGSDSASTSTIKSRHSRDSRPHRHEEGLR